MFDAEALLLVHDHQAQVLEREVLGQQPVRADHDVHGAVLDALDGLLGFLGALEAGQRLDPQREPGEPLGERLVVLLGEQGGGHQHGHLLAVLDRLERGPDRDLGLAVADVAGDQPVHRDLALHVGLDLVDGGQLVRGLHVREGFLQLALPRGVRAEGVAAGGHPGRVQPDQLAGDFLDGLAGLGLGAGPVRAAHLAQRRGVRRRRSG